jgi:hypothetical protein
VGEDGQGGDTEERGGTGEVKWREMAKSQQEKVLLSLSGEFAVASFLCLKGCMASLTLKNYPGVDIFVFNPKNNLNVSIQVKTKMRGREYFLPENINNTDPVFVFVTFQSREICPEFFIVPANLVAEISEKERQDWITLHPNAKKEQPRMISIADIQQFKDQWQYLGLGEL